MFEHCKQPVNSSVRPQAPQVIAGRSGIMKCLRYLPPSSLHISIPVSHGLLSHPPGNGKQVPSVPATEHLIPTPDLLGLSAQSKTPVHKKNRPGTIPQVPQMPAESKNWGGWKQPLRSHSIIPATGSSGVEVFLPREMGSVIRDFLRGPEAMD